MTLPELIDLTRLELRRDGRVTNARILEQCPAEESAYWLRQVRDQLMFDGLAEDDKQLGLRLIPAGKLAPEREFDVFISYARKDNLDSRIDEIYQQVGRRFFENSGRTLRIFYDRHDINGGDDWNRRLADGLRQSKIMIAVLSPNYFNSEWCQKEWAEFYQQEIGLSLFEEGIAPVYVIRMPDLLDAEVEQLDDWRRDLRKRQLMDLADWFTEGETTLVREDIQQRFRQLDELCFKRLDRIDRVRQSKHNLPRHFRQFFGREDDIRLIQQTLNREQPPVVALWGMAGIGKSALAMEYGLAFADRYAGGRFQLPSANMISIVASLKELLVRELNVTFTDDENKDDQLAYVKIQHQFETPFLANANHHTLLIFDNVEEPHQMFSLTNIQQWIPQGVHVLLTTRQQVESDANGLLTGQFVGELSESASVRLLGSYRPFSTDADKQTATSIAQRLGGYALALNVAGVFLSNTAGYPYAKLLQGLEQDDIRMLDMMGLELENAATTNSELYEYSVRVVKQLFMPLLDQLTPEQRRAVEYAALLPPDAVALPWLEELLTADFPALIADENDPFVGVTPWNRLVRELKRLTIWLDTNEPNVVTMHRVLQRIVGSAIADRIPALTDAVYALTERRAGQLTETWYHPANRWEVNPLVAFTNEKLSRGEEKAVELSNYVCQSLQELGFYAETYALLNKAITISQQMIPSVIQCALFSRIALIQRFLGKLVEAESWMKKSIAIAEANYEPTHPHMGVVFSSMAMIQQDLGKLVEAESWMKKSIAIVEANYEPTHPHMGLVFCNMALIQRDLGKLVEAERWMQKSIAIYEASYESTHPELSKCYSNIALIQRDLGKLVEAEGWMRKSIAIGEANYESTHPELSKCYSNMAWIQQDLGKLVEAESWMKKSMAIVETNYESTHPHMGLVFSNMAMIQRGLGNLLEAEGWMRKSMAIDEANYKPAHPALVICYSNMAIIQQAMGKLEEAEYWMRKSMAIAEVNYEPTHPHLGILYSNMANIEQHLVKLMEAEGWMRKSIAIDEANYEPTHPQLGILYLNMAGIQQAMGKLEEAEYWMRKSMANGEANYEPTHPSLGIRYSNMAVILNDRGKREQACQLWLKAYWILYEALGEQHPNTGVVMNFLQQHCPNCFEGRKQGFMSRLFSTATQGVLKRPKSNS